MTSLATAIASQKIYASISPFPLDFDWIEKHVGREVQQTAIKSVGGGWHGHEVRNAIEDFQQAAYKELAHAVYPVLKKISEACKNGKNEVECALNEEGEKWMKMDLHSGNPIIELLFKRGCQIHMARRDEQYVFAWVEGWVRWWTEVGEEVVDDCSTVVGKNYERNMLELRKNAEKSSSEKSSTEEKKSNEGSSVKADKTSTAS